MKDPSNPENEGKVFLYKYGKKIFDKIMSAMQPEFEDEELYQSLRFLGRSRLQDQDQEGCWLLELRLI